MIGTPALAIRVQSTVPGQFANLNLVGTQTISDVAAADIAGTGRYLAPFVVNRNPNGVVINGFGDPNPAVPVATLSQSLLIALSALLLLVGIRAQRFQRRTKNQNV